MNKEIAFCGLVCTDCPIYIATATQDEEKKEQLAREYSTETCTFEKEDMVCYGCHSQDEAMKHSKMCGDCEIRNCKKTAKIDTCASCEAYPCAHIERFVPADGENRKRLEKIRIDQYWKIFLEAKNVDAETTYLEAFHFEMTEYLANYLLDLVLRGQKKATASSLKSWEVEGTMPKEGDYSIVTDWAGKPRCVIQTKKITVLPFNEIDFALCSKEGEDDSLESWREGHRAFFTAEGKEELDYTFTEDMMVVFEEFEVVYQ
ncbi:ASCH domain-containing protein [Anaerosporobacter faecicola]|uniref:ASCH domain-containing protein n=1 Tax=Anaerosporobacter faecicola TaxID=2718714 RepID=UPI001439C6A9|nr:ASCH domain-containing protein [Anaerosporobacter faecicola]